MVPSCIYTIVIILTIRITIRLILVRVDPGAHKWAQGGRLKIRLTCIGILSSYFPLLQNVCVWYRVEKQGFSIFSYINFLSATTEEAFIANARPYKFVAQLKSGPTRFR